jgi:hypothetical protein
MVVGLVGIAAAQQTPTVTQLLEQGFAVVGTDFHPPKVIIFLRKDNVLILCEAGNYPIVTQRCSRIE